MSTCTCICCSCKQRMPHDQLRHKLRTSKFCLLPPGDTSSSRRLTEVMLAGCIPVFIGGPWHSMPLADFVDYKYEHLVYT